MPLLPPLSSLSLSLMDPETQPPADPPTDLHVRPLGGTEYSWYRAVPGGTGITVLCLRLSKPIPFSSLQSALHSLQNHHPILRAHLTFTPESNPFFSIPSSSSLTLQTQSTSLPFHSLVELELNRNPWSNPSGSDAAEGLPVFFATVYELPEPDRSVLSLRFHTGACDRTSAVAILRELMNLMGTQTGDEERESDTDDVAPNSGIEDLIPKQDTWKPFWARGKDLLGYSLNGLRSSTLRFEETGTDRSTELIRLVMDTEETQRLLAECKERGVKLCSATSAAALLAARLSKQMEEGQSEAYSVVTLVDCRNYLDPVLNERNIGFYHSAITNIHWVHGGENLWDLAKRCHDSYTNAKNNRKHLTDIGDVNFLMCRAIENPQLTADSALRTALISVFEEPVIYESSDLQRSLGVEDYVGCASVNGIGPSIGVFDTVRDGELDCACVYPSPLHSRNQMQEMVDHMKNILVGGSDGVRSGDIKESM